MQDRGMALAVNGPSGDQWRANGRLMAVAWGICLALLLALGGPSSANAMQDQVIRGGWYPWKPYQYLEKSDNMRRITGLDVQLLRAVFEDKLGRTLELPQVGWDRHQKQIRSGDRDVAGGAFMTEERSQYAYFSEPYRTEDIILVSRRDQPTARAMLQPSVFSQSFPKSQLRLGVVSGYVYGDAIDQFLRAPSNRGRWLSTSTDLNNLQNLIDGKVDLVAIDRLVGGTLLWEQGFTSQLVAGNQPIFSGPIVVLFSRRTTSPALVNAFNHAMETLRQEGRYNQIVRDYLFPTLLGMTAGQPWFFALETIGTAAFAFSGVLLAQQERFSLFGAFVLASLPAVGGGILRDLIVNRDRPAVLQSVHNLTIVIVLVLFSYIVMRAPLPRRLPRWTHHLRLNGAWMIQVLDALGLAAFTVVGVIVAVEEQCDPLLIWGPVFSAMTGAGGAILRDVIRADASHPTLRHEIYAEISLFWGFVLSLFISFYADSNSVNPIPLNTAVILTAMGCLITRLLVMQLQIKPPAFGRIRKLGGQ